MTVDMIYTPKEVAKILKVSEQVIAEELKSGNLLGFRVGRQWRIAETALKAYIEENTISVNKLEEP